MPFTNILYIEDDLGLAELVRIKLKRESYLVVHAESGHKGLMLLSDQDFVWC
jgi:DNA-binding response OmpR family regulator